MLGVSAMAEPPITGNPELDALRFSNYNTGDRDSDLKRYTWDICTYLTQNIEDLHTKDYLLMAMRSHIRGWLKRWDGIEVTKEQAAEWIGDWFNSLSESESEGQEGVGNE